MFINKLCDDKLKDYGKNKSFDENEINLRNLGLSWPYSMSLTKITNKLNNLGSIHSQYSGFKKSTQSINSICINRLGLSPRQLSSHLQSYESKTTQTQCKMINALISKTNGPADFAKFKAFNKLKRNVCFNRKQRLVFVFIFILIC